MPQLPSGQVRYPSHSWGPLAEDPSLDVGIVGEALAEAVRKAWIDAGGTDQTFAETFPHLTGPAQATGTGLNRAMIDGLNEGVIGDTAKLMAHRLIVRMLRRDPALVARAKVAHARQAEQFAGWPFVREWQELLELPAEKLASKLISRDREMVRLRNTSPFYLAEGVDLGDYDARVRLRRAARRVVERGLKRGVA